MTAASTAVFIESNTSGSGADFILRARDLGLDPVFLTDAPARYPFLRHIPEVDVRICDTSSVATVSVCLDIVAADKPVALVLSTSDYYLHMAALQAERLGLAGPIPAAIALCRDKARQADAVFAVGVCVAARSVTISAIAEAPQAIARVGLPAVIKPVDGTGSVGVRLVETTNAAMTALKALLAATVNARGQPVVPRALLASYVEGDEFSVEILDGAIIGVTRKHLGPLPYFVEIGHDFPAPIPVDLRRRIEREARRAIEAVGHTRGPAHVELRVNPDAITIIEINPRLAGGSIPSLIRHATGVDPVAAVIESARRGRPNIVPDKSDYGSLRFIVPRADGWFHPRRPLDDVAGQFGLAEIALYRQLPTEFRRCNDFRDRVGHVIAVDADPALAAGRADAAAALLCQE